MATTHKRQGWRTGHLRVGVSPRAAAWTGQPSSQPVAHADAGPGPYARLAAQRRGRRDGRRSVPAAGVQEAHTAFTARLAGRTRALEQRLGRRCRDEVVRLDTKLVDAARAVATGGEPRLVSEARLRRLAASRSRSIERLRTRVWRLAARNARAVAHYRAAVLRHHPHPAQLAEWRTPPYRPAELWMRGDLPLMLETEGAGVRDVLHRALRGDQIPQVARNMDVPSQRKPIEGRLPARG